MNRPNILYIHSHDTGRYVQPYGYDIPTPNIQRLADQGVLFRQAFCANPTCSPSRACLLTGMSAHGNGMIGLAHRGFGLNDYSQHILHTLRTVGYRSTLIGIQHIAPGDQKEIIGYDEIVDLPDIKNGAPGRAAADWLRNRKGCDPFFLSVGFFETHRVFPEPDPQDNPDNCRPPAPLPDSPRTRYDMACYKASARILDDGIGQVLQALDETGLAENTLVICTTDHGIAFPRMKCNLTDHGIGVMLIMRGPGGFAGGKAIDGMVSQIDLFPTVCELLQIDRPAWLEGRSVLPMVRGDLERVNEEIFAEVNYHAAYEPKRCVRTERYKYIRRYEDRGHPILPNCDDSPSKDLLLEAGWRDRAPAEEHLFDLVFDPNEACNLVGKPEMETVLDEMRDRLQRWMELTSDPLLIGPVAAPKGAKVNDPDGMSPKDTPSTIE